MQVNDRDFLSPGAINVHVAISNVWRRLSQVYAAREARMGAWWLLARLTGRSQTILVARGVVTLDEFQITRLRGWIDDICERRMPIQYVVGSIPFANMQIAVNPPVLIPRPETEEWVVNLCDRLRMAACDKPLKVLDLCTGSGCIAIALAKVLPADSVVVAVDINPEALMLAHRNAVANGVNITCLESDLFQKLDGCQFDLIVANPPYVTEQEWETLDGHITNWEDRRALVAPDRGLAILKRIIADAPNFLCKNSGLGEDGIGQVVVEIGAGQADAVVSFMTQHGYQAVTVAKDLAGRDRTISGSVANVAKAVQQKRDSCALR